MKLEGSDPPRIDEAEDSELGRLARAARSRGAGASATARMAQRLAPARAAAAAASATSSKPSVFGQLGGAKLGALALIALGTAIFALQTRSAEHTAPPPIPTTTETIAVPTPPSPTLEAIPTFALPSSATAAPVAAGASAVAPRPSSSHAVPTSEGEFAFITRAEDALAADPARALAIVEDHARKFPAGELVQERELIAALALARLGRKTEAMRRANALLRLYPKTPYVARLERALGEPLSPELPSSAPR